MLERPARERQIANRASGEDFEHLLDLRPAEQPIDADVTRQPRRWASPCLCQASAASRVSR